MMQINLAPPAVLPTIGVIGISHFSSGGNHFAEVSTGYCLYVTFLI